MKIADYLNKKNLSYILFSIFWGFFLILLMFISLELGCHKKDLSDIFSINPNIIVLNLLSLCSFFALIYLVFSNLFTAGICFTVFCSLIAAVNYYVIEWHGTPLSLHDVKNATTAFNVLGEYKFEFFPPVIYISLIFVFAISLTLLWRHLVKRRIINKDIHKEKKNCVKSALRRRAWILGFAVVSISCTAVMFHFYAPKNPLSVHWTMGYHKFGFTVSAISREVNYNQVEKPEGYDNFDFDTLGTIFGEKEEKREGSAKPDIIMILNESFFDPQRITEIKTDTPYMSYISSLENVTRGYAVVHDAGGGTNKSEYEFLTGNSEHLMPGITPFNELNLKGANSVVSYLKSLGYSTLASHPFTGINYNRKTSYTDLGFDTIYFRDDFQDREFYYDRQFTTDLSSYENLLRWYSEEGESPRFLFLLTIQNHGGYENNDPETDKVHVLDDFGGLEDQMNEYLTSIKLSDEAFQELTTRLKDSDRPVYVCMVGDHCPSFFVNFGKQYREGNDYEIAVRSVPFIIWSNVGEGRGDIGTISLNYLLPTLLEEAGLPLSDYYSHLLTLKKDVPVLTDIGFYRDSNGTDHGYDTDSQYKEKVDACFYMEYNNLMDKARRQELFDPPNN